MPVINNLINGLNIIKKVYDEEKIEICQSDQDCFELLIIVESLDCIDETATDERCIELKYQANCNQRTLLNNYGFKFFGTINDSDMHEYIMGYEFSLSIR